MSRSKTAGKGIREDIAQTIRKAFPTGRMPFAVDIQKTYLADVFPKLKTKLLRLGNAAILFERDPEGGAGWSAGEGRLEAGPGPLARIDRSSSYYLFFVAPEDETFRFVTGDPSIPERGEIRTVGYSVALSAMAPAALVVLNHMRRRDVVRYAPDIVPETIANARGKLVEIGDFCRETLPKEGLETLAALAGEITSTLEAFGVKVLPEEEQHKPVAWLEIPALTRLGSAQGRTFSVRDALFFWTM